MNVRSALSALRAKKHHCWGSHCPAARWIDFNVSWCSMLMVYMNKASEPWTSLEKVGSLQNKPNSGNTAWLAGSLLFSDYQIIWKFQNSGWVSSGECYQGEKEFQSQLDWLKSLDIELNKWQPSNNSKKFVNISPCYIYLGIFKFWCRHCCWAKLSQQNHSGIGALAAWLFSM